MIKNIIVVLICYLYDLKRFYFSSSINGVYKNKNTLIGHILRISHALEKGLALPETRKGYGKKKLSQLINDTELFYNDYGWHKVVDISISSIESLLEFHKSTGDIDEKLLIDFNSLKSKVTAEANLDVKAGIKIIDKSEFLDRIKIDPEGFFLSRYSVRQFSNKKVTLDKLLRAVSLATKTPSVCNRQTCKARIFHSEELITKVLSFQDGNKGFGHEATAVFVVTSDMSNFYKSGERSQGFIDGGLFAMSLVYALHSIGLGSCMLNWSMGYRSDKRFRNEFNIPDNELVIMMIAVGELKDEINVAESPRKNLEDFYTVEG